MTISFSVRANCKCDGCSITAGHGFFVSQTNDPDSEIFLCSGCAQKDLPLNDLEAAVDACRDGGPEVDEEERRLESVYLDWINSYEEVAA
jgi:hypothetical protein